MSKDVTIEVPCANGYLVANAPIPVSADTPPNINMDDYMLIMIPKTMFAQVCDLVRNGLKG